jgi:F0F1-type ATP synthase membrane subunit a
MPNLLAAADPLDHVLPHEVYHSDLLNLHVTNQMVMAVIAALLMLAIFPVLFRRAYVGAPTGARNLFESILEFLRVEVFRPALKEHTDRFVPFLWTLFFFILFCNLLGSIPIAEILSLILRRDVHFGGTATGNIMTTAGLAITAFCFIHLNGIWQIARSLMDGTYGHHGHHEEHSSNGEKHHEAAHDLEHMRGEGLAADVPQNVRAATDPTKHYADDQHHAHSHHRPDDGHLHDHGHAHPHGRKMAAPAAIAMGIPLYFWNFAPHPFKPEPGESPVKWIPDLIVWGLLLVLELVGAVIKPVSLSIRLFANMIAGHIVLAVLVGLIVSVPSVWGQLGVGIPLTLLALLIRVLELFVAFLQAYIFTFLTTLFIASAVAPEH